MVKVEHRFIGSEKKEAWVVILYETAQDYLYADAQALIRKTVKELNQKENTQLHYDFFKTPPPLHIEDKGNHACIDVYNIRSQELV